VYEHLYKFRVTAYYIGTKNIWIPDYIGRDAELELPKAEAVAKLQRELIDPHLPGFKFLESTRLLQFFTPGNTVMESFAFPGGETSSVEAPLIGHSRTQPLPKFSEEQLEELL